MDKPCRDCEADNSEPCDECGVDTVKLLDERDKLQALNTRLEAELEKAKHERNAEGMRVRGEFLPKLTKLTEVVKACEVALRCAASMNPGRSDLKFNDQWERARLQSVHAIALIHTLQSGEKKEGSK